MRVAAALLVATAVSVLLRTGGLHAGFWIDEGIAVGIASHDLGDIPALLRQDGSPPLYYLVLHEWLALFGSGEAAARSLSLVFAAAAVPVSWSAGTAIAGRRAGAVAAALAAGCPLLSYYAQEARMYTLVALLSLIATTAFVRGHRITLAGALVLLLYAHTWGVFLVAAIAVAWVADGRDRREGAQVAAAVALLYAPWLPSLAFQALHTGAPWSVAPSVLVLGACAVPAAVAWRARSETVRLLALLTTVAVALAWLASQFEPAWSARYLAVVYGPAALALACATARARPWVAGAVAIAALGMLAVPLPARSNARAVAVSAGIGLRPGDLVISTQPEQVPVLERYLPSGVVFLTPLGRPADPTVMDWRDALRRLRCAPAPARLELTAGRRVVLVTPVLRRARSPWARAVRRRTREWRAVLRHDPRLRRLGATSRPDPRGFRSAVRAEIFQARKNEGRPSKSAAPPSFPPLTRRCVWMPVLHRLGARSTLSPQRSSTVTSPERSDHPLEVVFATDQFLDTSTWKLGRLPTAGGVRPPHQERIMGSVLPRSASAWPPSVRAQFRGAAREPPLIIPGCAPAVREQGQRGSPKRSATWAGVSA